MVVLEYIFCIIIYCGWVYNLDKLLKKESHYNLWNFEVNSLHLWPLIRSSIFSRYEMSDRGYTKPHYVAANKYNILSPKLWKNHFIIKLIIA